MEEPAKIGRPSEYTQEIGDRICDQIATSHASLRTVCKPEDMPATVTVLRWLRDFESFRIQYARAKAEQASLGVEEMYEISDDGTNDFYVDEKTGKIKVDHENIQRSRLRVDTRKWVASKLLPKIYGDKLDITSGGDKIDSNSTKLVELLSKKELSIDELLKLANDDEPTKASGENPS